MGVTAAAGKMKWPLQQVESGRAEGEGEVAASRKEEEGGRWFRGRRSGRCLHCSSGRWGKKSAVWPGAAETQEAGKRKEEEEEKEGAVEAAVAGGGGGNTGGWPEGEKPGLLQAEWQLAGRWLWAEGVATAAAGEWRGRWLFCRGSDRWCRGDSSRWEVNVAAAAGEGDQQGGRELQGRWEQEEEKKKKKKKKQRACCCRSVQGSWRKKRRRRRLRQRGTVQGKEAVAAGGECCSGRWGKGSTRPLGRNAAGSCWQGEKISMS
ncbi:hypothetical protein MRB53_034533 [Persea americana]|uniref:Uncharacterized protein n=1 Tax=Persea americana TaxID=3435 RepID=A0ACC2K216_PERAE|nr:hypothetical protein MRB53_034533 [Persea americana]